MREQLCLIILVFIYDLQFFIQFTKFTVSLEYNNLRLDRKKENNFLSPKFCLGNVLGKEHGITIHCLICVLYTYLRCPFRKPIGIDLKNKTNHILVDYNFKSKCKFLLHVEAVSYCMYSRLCFDVGHIGQSVSLAI